jgi:hypothetical protein
MSISKVFKFTNISKQQGYLIEFCENIFEENNFREEPIIAGMPERMVYETEIWMVGEKLRQEISKLKKDEATPLLLDEVLKVINTTKYRKGRESFVMTLHYFKNSPKVESCLENLLDDKQLYGFAIKELNKLKIYDFTGKVRKISEKEKIAWIKKEIERYIKNSL